MAWHFRFKHEKRQRQRNQEQTREIHGKEIQRIQCEDEADATDHPRRDHPRMRKFGVKPKDTENQQDEDDIRLDNARKKFLPS